MMVGRAGWLAALLVAAAAEQETYVMIDQEEAAPTKEEVAAHTREEVAHTRVERGAEEEGSGGLLGNHFADYGIDDEDQVSPAHPWPNTSPDRPGERVREHQPGVEPGGAGGLLPGLLPPAHHQAAEVTSRSHLTPGPSPGTSAPPPRQHGVTPVGPARPPRLSSYYPGGAEGSGGDYISTLRDYNNTDDLISPTRTQVSGGAVWAPC